MKFSIIIPTYEMHGNGVKYLTELFDSIKLQTYENYEVVISDHSKDLVIRNFVLNYKQFKNIIYLKNEVGIGNSSINMNNGIRNATGDIIKIMHMDDKFCNINTLQLIKDEFEKYPDRSWGGVSFNHYYQDSDITKRTIILNESKIYGCPSVGFFKNDMNYYDENLILINDGFMFFNLKNKYGTPIAINQVCVTIRQHSDQVTHKIITKEIEEREFKYVRERGMIIC